MNFFITPDLTLNNRASPQRLIDFRKTRGVAVEGWAGIFQPCLSVLLERTRWTSPFFKFIQRLFDGANSIYRMKSKRTLDDCGI